METPSFPLKAAALLLLLVLVLLPSSSPLAEDADPLSLFDRHTAQLNRLEALVDALSLTVSTLESSLAACSARHSAALHTSPGGSSADSAAPGVAVRKHKPLWSERFQFAATVHLDSEATYAAVLPYEDLDGLSKYFAVGDTRGRVYIFSAAGDLIMELPTICEAPVTSILTYMSFRKNESLLFTGHADGSVTAHRVWESVTNEWLTLSLGSSKQFIRGDHDSPAVTGLEVHQVGRTRYIIATDGSGRIRVFTESGTLYGTAIASSRPLAFVRQRLVFLTETGAASLDLRSMAVKEIECEGLNGTAIKSYTFDVSESIKAYGFTADGDLVHVILLGDAANLKCRVRSIRKSEVENPISIRTIKGYLLVGSLDKVLVYNISSQYYGRVGAPRLLFFATIKEIKSQFLSEGASVEGFSSGEPLIAADREKLVVLGLGGGYVGIYRSTFPVYRPESHGVAWSVPVLLFLLFLIGIWQFYVKKKDDLGWKPEEAFNDPGAKSGSHLSAPAGDRAYPADAPMASELRALRGGGLRGPSRVYGSAPPRYPGESSMGFRPTATESGFRATAELKYRGQSVDSAVIPKRRDPLYADSEVGDSAVLPKRRDPLYVESDVGDERSD